MRQFTRNFWLYLAAGAFWSLGLMTFFLIYNLHLLDLGFNETFMGQVSAAMTLGSLAVTLPSGFLLNRYGLSRIVQISVLTTGITLLLRSLTDVASLLVLFAFLNGAAVGAWIVSAPPFLTKNTKPEIRSRAFSLNYGSSIGIGIIAGLLAGVIPQLLSVWSGAEVLPELRGRRYILFGCSAVVLLAYFILLWLKEDSEQQTIGRTPLRLEGRFLRQVQSRSFVLRLLIVLVLWSFFMGSFPPFFNVFFHKKYNQSMEGIGLIFSLSQFCQVLAVLSMPWLIRKLGRVVAIFFMQLAASTVLPMLIVTSNVRLAGLVYLLYLSFQVMSEPAVENFIMDSVLPQERNIVSALRYMTLFLIQALSVWLSGFALAQFGYSSLLIAIAIVGMSASFTFYFFFNSREKVQLSKNSATVLAPVSSEAHKGQ